MSPILRLSPASLAFFALLLTPAWASADEEESAVSAAASVSQWSFRHESVLGIRATPLGLNVNSLTGFRVYLSGSESALLRNTYVESGLATGLSPAYLWAGPYIDALPIALLHLRFSAQSMWYLGSLGYLIDAPESEDGTPFRWSMPALSDIRSQDDHEGVAARGAMLRAVATPRYMRELTGSLRLVFTAETSWIWMNTTMANRYYEPFHDLLLNPNDRIFSTQPTLGVLLGSQPAETHLLLGVRYEYTNTENSDVERQLLGLVFRWKMPARWGVPGEPVLSGMIGASIAHTTQGEETQGRVGAPYFGVLYTSSWERR